MLPHDVPVALRSVKTREYPLGLVELTLTDLQDLYDLLKAKARSVSIRLGDEFEADTIDDLRHASPKGLQSLHIQAFEPGVAVTLNAHRPHVRSIFGDEEGNRLARDVSEWFLSKTQRNYLRLERRWSLVSFALGAAGAGYFALSLDPPIRYVWVMIGLVWIGSLAAELVRRHRWGYVRVMLYPEEVRQSRRDWRRDTVLGLALLTVAFLLGRYAR